MSDFKITFIKADDTFIRYSDSYPVISSNSVSTLVDDSECITLLDDIVEFCIDAPKGYYEKMDNEQEILDVLTMNEGGNFH